MDEAEFDGPFPSKKADEVWKLKAPYAITVRSAATAVNPVADQAAAAVNSARILSSTGSASTLPLLPTAASPPPPPPPSVSQPATSQTPAASTSAVTAPSAQQYAAAEKAGQIVVFAGRDGQGGGRVTLTRMVAAGLGMSVRAFGEYDDIMYNAAAAEI